MSRNRWSNLPVPAVAPSILAADLGHLADEVARAEAAGADAIHLDVMDGHFVPNLTFGPAVCEAVRRATNLYLDVDLMLDAPGDFVKPFAEAGADNITFHAEVVGRPGELVDRIHELGCEAGVKVDPDGPASLVRPVVDQVELVLVMSVYAGFGGQAFMPEVLDKMREIRSWLKDGQRLEVDGGINSETAALVMAAGADVLVAGTAVFKAADPATAIRRIRAAGSQAEHVVEPPGHGQGR